MRAITVTESGGPDVLVLRETTAPQPGPGEVLVKTAVTGVNFIEIYQRAGVYSMSLPFTPGSEGAGTVTALGAGVTDLQVGDRIATAGASATYAEEFVVAADQAVRVPETIDFDTAGALPLQGCTAHYLATSAANPEPGETVLVHAGAGGVGLLLTQLLVARGVTVITTASSDEKRSLSRDAGAAHSLEYDQFAQQVRDLTDGHGVAIVYDGVGRDTFDDSLASLAVRGRLVLFGGASGQVPPFDLQRLNSAGSVSVTRPSLTHFMRTREEIEWRYRSLFAAIDAGTLRLRIGQRFSFENASDAHRALEGRGTTGKLILTH